MIGHVFGELTVLEELDRRYQRGRVYRCACSCGAHAEVPGFRLRGGITKSCGHLRGRNKREQPRRERTLQMRMSEAEWTALHGKATAAGITMSSLIRMLIADAVVELDPKYDPLAGPSMARAAEAAVVARDTAASAAGRAA